MGRARSEGVDLPKGVHVVKKPSGRRYYYWHPGRGTDAAQKPVPLGSDPADPAFWVRLRKLTGEADQKGTFAALIAEYFTSPSWARLRPASQKIYAFHLRRIEAAAGDRSVTALTRADLYRWRDGMAATPSLANHALSVMAGLLEFAVQRDYRADNPAVRLDRLEHDIDGAHPWHEDAWRFIVERAPTDIRRLAILGRATGQRQKDLIALRPADRHLDGFSMRISKLRDKPHFMPLTQAEIREIDGWRVEPLDLYLKDRKGRRYTEGRLRGRLVRWLAGQPALAEHKLTIHGLRAMAVCDRRLRLVEHQAIAAELCMSLPKVMHYSRFIDQAALARKSRDQREQNEPGFGNSPIRLVNRE